MSRSLALALLAAAAAISPAQAASVDLSAFVNADLRGYTQGPNYPVGGQTVNIGGIDFALDNSCGTNSLCAIQTNGTQTYAIPVLQTGITSVYTIINSAAGSFGANNGSLTFLGSGGATATFDLIQGDNIRDHYFGSFNNTATGIYATTGYLGGAPAADAPGRVHLDVQRFDLPVAFAGQTLTSITFDSTGTGGQPFLAAITTATSSVPEPATWAMLVGGFGMTGAALRRRERRPALA